MTNFFALPGPTTAELIEQLEYQELKTEEEKAKFAYELGFKHAFRKAQKQYEPKINITEDENSGMLPPL